MTRPRAWSGRFALLLLLPVCFLPLVVSGQRAFAPVRSPRVADWSTRHVVYTQFGTSNALELAGRDPRANMRWREVEQRETIRRLNEFQSRSYLQFGLRNPVRRFPIRQTTTPQRDWSVSLGVGTTAPAMFPAKFSFDTTAAPNCTNDFVVFPVNVGSTNGQPNIVAFNNLYSGTGGGTTGICATRTTPGGHSDTKSSPTVLWSYNIHSINPTGTGGAVPTSPSLSLDGTKVAFVESATGNPAHFHVLAWKSGDGQSTNLQTVTGGKEITSPSSNAPAAGSGSFTDLTLGATTDTNSSPYVDYANDTAYVGNDSGSLYRIKNVFCTLPTCATAIPGLDSTWGTGGVVATGCTGKLTAPVQDFPSLNVYVGCSDGKVYGFNSVGTPLPNSPLLVGDGSPTGGIVDPPIVDPVNAVVYAAAGTGASPNGASAVVVQAKRDLSGARVATIGPAGQFKIHSPAFNDPYFTSATNTSWILYAASLVKVGTNKYDVNLFGMTFDASRNMQTGTPTNSYDYGTIEGEYAPLTEFKNGTTDQLFFGLLLSSGTALNLGNFNINSFPSTTPPGIGEGNGPSGMIVDNASTSAQASSIYFGVQGSNTAVKLTQAGLN
ncbi:MAG TPA: hypothetical protein VMP12_01180 [Candidatus Sulfotelmatobacter sp.]|nr:hypothetical protein [Candidatus Sulfotelmatobacter sp.]